MGMGVRCRGRACVGDSILACHLCYRAIDGFGYFCQCRLPHSLAQAVEVAKAHDEWAPLVRINSIFESVHQKAFVDVCANDPHLQRVAGQALSGRVPNGRVVSSTASSCTGHSAILCALTRSDVAGVRPETPSLSFSWR